MAAFTAANFDIFAPIAHKGNPEAENTRKNEQANRPAEGSTSRRHADEICPPIRTHLAGHIRLLNNEPVLS